MQTADMKICYVIECFVSSPFASVIPGDMELRIFALFLVHCFVRDVSGQGLEFYVSVDGSGWHEMLY